MDVLVDSPHFVSVGVGLPVGAHEPVVAEVAVGRVVGVEVASVGVYHRTVVSRPPYGLVHEVPDEASLIFRIFPHYVPVFPESALGVAHRVSVFALDQRLPLRRVFAVAYAAVISEVHGAVDVAFPVISGLLVLYGARGVFRLYPVVGGLEIGAVARLVAERPEDDARMVEIPLHVPLVPFHVRQRVVLPFRERSLPVAHPVALYVRLRHHVQSVAVAELIPERVVGVVAGAHCVDVELFHQEYVLEHPLAADRVAAVRIHLVTVDSLEQHALSVHEHQGVLYLYFSEADVDRNGLAAGADHQPVEVWRLRRPFVRILYIEAECPRSLHLAGHDRVPLGVQQLEPDLHPAAAQPDLQGGVGIFGVEVREHPHVLNPLLLPGIQPAVPSDSGVPEEVLVFEIGPVAPAEDLEADEVLFSRLEPAGDVELGLELAILAVAGIPAVHPEIHVRGDGPEKRDYVLALPVRGNLDDPAVAAHMVVLHWNQGRIVPVLVPPGVAYVHVYRVAVAVELPDARNRNLVPEAVVVAGFEEIGRPVVGVPDPCELPFAVEAQEVRRLFGLACEGRVPAFVGEVGGVHRSSSEGIHFGVPPFVEGLRPGGNARRQQGGGNQESNVHAVSFSAV